MPPSSDPRRSLSTRNASPSSRTVARAVQLISGWEVSLRDVGRATDRTPASLRASTHARAFERDCERWESWRTVATTPHSKRGARLRSGGSTSRASPSSGHRCAAVSLALGRSALRSGRSIDGSRPGLAVSHARALSRDPEAARAARSAEGARVSTACQAFEPEGCARSSETCRQPRFLPRGTARIMPAQQKCYRTTTCWRCLAAASGPAAAQRTSAVSSVALPPSASATTRRRRRQLCAVDRQFGLVFDEQGVLPPARAVDTAAASSAHGWLSQLDGVVRDA